MGRPPSNTKIMPKRVHLVRTMGGNTKFRALRLDHGNFGWASEGIARTTRIVDVVYNATSNELVRTKTLVKGAICAVDATPFRSYYENHYAQALGRKKTHNFTDEEKAAGNFSFFRQAIPVVQKADMTTQSHQSYLQ